MTKMYQMTTDEDTKQVIFEIKNPQNSIHGTIMESQTLLITWIKHYLQMASFNV